MNIQEEHNKILKEILIQKLKEKSFKIVTFSNSPDYLSSPYKVSLNKFLNSKYKNLIIPLFMIRSHLSEGEDLSDKEKDTKEIDEFLKNIENNSIDPKQFYLFDHDELTDIRISYIKISDFELIMNSMRDVAEIVMIYNTSPAKNNQIR